MMKDKKNKKPMPTSKKLIIFLFVNCTIIELFTGGITIASLLLARETLLAPDFSPLITLIGGVVSEVIGYAVYALKSAKENTKGGITYELALKELQEQGIDPVG